MEKGKTATVETVTANKPDAKVRNNSDMAKELAEKVQSFKENLQKLLINNIPDENEPPSLFSMNGVDVIPKRSISIVSAQKKSGKSNFAGLLMTACCNDSHNVLDGAIKSKLGALKVLNIDTEQPLKDARRTLRRVMKTAGYNYDEQWNDHNIFSVSVKDYSAEDRRIITEVAISEYEPDIVFIDGIADLVKSINDEVENTELMSWMDYLSCQFDCAVVGMLHLNYGTGKIGGWAGTQANKKFTDSFTLKKDKQNGYFKIEHEGRGENAPDLRFKIVCPQGQSVGWWEAVDGVTPKGHEEEDERTELQKLIDNAPFPCNTTKLARWIMTKKGFTSESPAKKRISKCEDYGLIRSDRKGRESIWCKVSEPENTQEKEINFSNGE